MTKINIKPIYITLVNEADVITGYEEKLLVHQKGLLHRAFSILIFNKDGQLLLHKRALSKYHSPGLWTNTCCGHPNQGEDLEDAIHRRLEEEMGFDCPLHFQFKFSYKAYFPENQLTEFELDHVYFGEYNESFEVNPEEVAEWRWVNVEHVKVEIAANPDQFTVWFKEIMQKF